MLPLLGEAIRCARTERQMSQEALADLAEIDRSHMGRIERGERNVTILNLRKISNALNVSMAALLSDARL
ncbi:helix-turn-helix domain-containing protein [Citromicrobium sp. RCC1897]|uniref:helix-turn-helix domain-containing protein n=1 Tax=Citromicrobium sp. RCC1897 TaxID=1812182 RepID=UPI0021016C1C|nr:MULTISPECIES: helix-turn-helix transcriptional regulator [unclassified Citromicrobium]